MNHTPLTYLDYAGAYPPDESLFEDWQALSRRCFVNPHSTTRFSANCKAMLHNAEKQLLEAVRISPQTADVIWTSGGTEALNLAIHGILADSGAPSCCRIDATAHAAMGAAARHFCTAADIPLHTLPVNRQGKLVPDGSLPGGRALVGVNHVNNETGVIRNLVEIRRHFPDVLLLVDALQSAGKLPLCWNTAGIDLLAVGGGKIGGPASVGALIVRKGVRLAPLMFGGGQQRGIRPGTVDVAAACLFADRMKTRSANAAATLDRVAGLREKLRAGLHKLQKINPLMISPPDASPYITCVGFPGYEGAILMRLLAERGVIVGSGSACSAESDAPSHVLQAMGYTDAEARSTLRISFGTESSGRDIDQFLTALEAVLCDY